MLEDKYIEYTIAIQSLVHNKILSIEDDIKEYTEAYKLFDTVQDKNNIKNIISAISKDYLLYAGIMREIIKYRKINEREFEEFLNRKVEKLDKGKRNEYKILLNSLYGRKVEKIKKEGKENAKRKN